MGLRPSLDENDVDETAPNEYSIAQEELDQDQEANPINDDADDERETDLRFGEF